jgi:DNA replication protein DnaC
MVGSMATICGCAIQSKIKIALPERYHDARLEDFSAAVRDPVTAWLEHPTDGLFVTGNCGTGKTHLGAAITRHLISKTIPVKFLRCADLFRGIREIFKSDSPYAESELMTPLEKYRVLILDDLGAGSLSDCERRYSLELIDARLSKMRPTIVTSNWNLEQIEKLMDDRIASRLSGFALLELGGKDRRMSA